MRTNIDIDDDLMREAMDAMNVRTKRDAVVTALRRAVELKRQSDALDQMRGKIKWVGDLEAMRLD